MNYTDFAILAVLGLSIIVGLMRGFVSEVWALACWILAGWVAWYCGPFVETWLPQDLATPGLRMVMAYVGCFILVVIAGSLVGYLLRRLVSGSGLSGTDRLLGLVFGLVRGVAVIVLVVLMLGFTPFHRDAWWQESRLLPTFESAAASLKAYLPAKLSDYLQTRDDAPEPDIAGAAKPGGTLIRDVLLKKRPESGSAEPLPEGQEPVSGQEYGEQPSGEPGSRDQESANTKRLPPEPARR